MKNWGFGEWFAVVFFTWWIPFAIYGYFTRGDDPAKREHPMAQPTQEQRNKLAADLCANARLDAERPELSPIEREQLTKAAEAVCKVTLPLIKQPSVAGKRPGG